MEKSIRVARILEYGKPLSLVSVPKPRIYHDEEVIVRVGAVGLCHSDLHLLNGEGKSIIPLDLPKTPVTKLQVGSKRSVNRCRAICWHQEI